MRNYPSSRTPKQPLAERECAVCGKRFAISNWQVRSSANGGNWCSRACYFASRVRKSLRDRLRENTNMDGPILRSGLGSCWEFTGLRSPLGYGIIGNAYRTTEGKKRNSAAHRVAWELVAGPIPDGLWVLHTCDNPPCVRNDDEGVWVVNGIECPRYGHLFLGTPADNSQDMATKGRAVSGERSHFARTTKETVLMLREQFNQGVGVARLSVTHRIPMSTVRNIVHGRSWKHLL